MVSINGGLRALPPMSIINYTALNVFFFFFTELYRYITAMHVLRIYESYIPVLLQYVTGSDVMLLSITVTAIVIIHISFHMYIYILHAA